MVENKKTLIERLRARQSGRKIEGEKGLALLDVLIGIAIFALIAIIAVSAINQYRQRAYESAAVSDAQAVGVSLEASYTDTQAYPALSITSGKYSTGDTPTKGITVGWTFKNDAEGFVFCLEHSSGTTKDAAVLYNSTTGGVVAKVRGAGCGAAPADYATAKAKTTL